MWKNSLYNTIGGIIRLALGLLSVPFLTKTLGVDKYGLYAAINAITSIALFSEWSLSASITVFFSKDLIKASSNLLNIRKYDTLSIAAIFVAMLASSTAILIYISSAWIATFFQNISISERLVLGDAIAITSGIVGIRLILQFFVGILQANKAYGSINLLSTFYTITSLLCTFYIAATSKDLVVMQELQLTLSLFILVLYYIFCARSGYLNYFYFTKPKLKPFMHLSTYGGKMWITSLGSTLFSQFDRILVLRLLGTEWAGIYSAITSLANQINVVSSMPVQPLLPVISEQSEDPQPSLLLSSILVKAFSINSFIIISAGSGLIMFSSQIVNFLFVKSHLDINTIITCLIIIVFAYSIYSFNAIGYFTLLAIKQESFTTKVTVISGMCSLMLIFALSEKYGILGACLGNIGYALTLLLNIKALNKLHINKGNFFEKTLLQLLISIIICSISVFYNVLILSLFSYGLLIMILLYFLNQKFSISLIKLSNVFNRKLSD